MMHEPRLEKGRTNPLKAFLVYISNLLFGFLSSKVLLPSNEAVLKAKSFVENQKICQVNLTFMSVPDEILERNLFELRCNWEKVKTFSYLGTAVKDKNPQGFIKFANIVNKYYVDKARLIRAGSDKNVSINYDKELIIRFPGYMSNSAKKFLLGLTHFLVIPYSFSTQSGVIAEALSYGKLLVINDIPAFSCFKNLEFVFLIDFNDESSILKCINYLFSMEISDYEKCYREAVNFYQKNYSVSYLSKTLPKVL
ncbi:glycosyltransferase [Aetokthonos hydrillicola]